jgi:hypothetical protein
MPLQESPTPFDCSTEVRSGKACVLSIVNYLTLGRRKVCESCLAKLKATEGMQMRTCIGIGIVVAVAIGLIWSVAAMSGWVPVLSAEMSSTGMLQRR